VKRTSYEAYNAVFSSLLPLRLKSRYSSEPCSVRCSALYNILLQISQLHPHSGSDYRLSS